MSVGISIKLFGKGLEFYLGKSDYLHSFRIASASVLSLDNWSLLTIEVAVRW